jgi:hypothetical protein
VGRGPDDAGGGPAYRQVILSQGYGLLSFRVDEAIELIRSFDIS